MAGVRFNINTGEVASGATGKTFLRVTAASNHRALIDELHIGFKGTSNTDAPFLLEIYRGRTDGSGSSAVTPAKENSGDSETLAVTAAKTFTGEPSGGTLIFATEIHPQGGFDWINTKNPFIILGGATLDFKITSAANYSGTILLRGEE